MTVRVDIKSPSDDREVPQLRVQLNVRKVLGRQVHQKIHGSVW
jgi:hypothetical protein